jgi:hypothetical protein
MKAQDLENRLINFAVSIIKGWKYLDKSFASEHLSIFVLSIKNTKTQ